MYFRDAHFYKRLCRIKLGDTYFEQFFARMCKNVTFIRIGQCPLTCKLCLACMLNFAELASWVKLVRQVGSFDQKFKKGNFVMVEKRSFWESPVKTSNVLSTYWPYNTSLVESFWVIMNQYELIIRRNGIGTQCQSFINISDVFDTLTFGKLYAS